MRVRDLRNHPLLLTVELVLLLGIGAMLLAHVEWQDKLATAPRAFTTAKAEGALLERLSFGGAVSVNAEFHHYGRLDTDVDGVRAVRVPSSSPARLFTLHPEDRREAWQNTPGPDFFLAGAHGRDVNLLSSDVQGGAERVTLDDDTNDRVYVIDGNLWLHSHDALEVRFTTSDGAPVRVTFVVRGDIYFLDDVRAQGPRASLAFVALPRPGIGARGGDVWLGDLAYRTLSHIDGYLFASGDIEGALFEEGLVVNGALAAGGVIAVDEGQGCRRAPLTVAFDARYANGAELPPGL